MEIATIVVVEDEALVAMKIESDLQKMGHTVIGICSSGEEALSCIKDLQPALVLMDIRLQGVMDGIETAARLLPELNIPVIFLTANSEESTIERAKATSPYGYLTKPVEAQELHIAIQIALYKHGQDHRLKQTEALLRESNARLQMIMNSVDALIYIADIQTHELLFINDYGLKSWGHDIVGQKCWKVFHSLDGPCSFCDNDRLLAENGKFTGVNRWEFQNLVNQRWYDMSDRAISWTDGRVVRLAIATDITMRKKLEEERAKIEAQQQHLQKAKSLGRMAGAIAHHFNNMLAAVMGNLELANQDLPQDSGTAKHLNAAMGAARRAADVSGLMLTYLGQNPGHQEAFDLAEFSRRVLPDLQAVLPKEVTLGADLPSPGPTVIADALQLQQLLTSLITNAGEAYGQETGEIHLKVTTVSAPEVPTTHRFPQDWQARDTPYACLEVRDAGCGIAEEHIDELFDPFFTTKFTGRGLGLPVVLGIVRTHGGAVTVESEEDRGTVFRVFLPISAEAVSPLPEKTSQAPEIGGGGTVLLVEDEPIVRDMAKAMLAHLGFSVLEAKDGIDAVEMFQQHQDLIRCVISDLSMPRMDGWQALFSLRQIKAGIPVILASGYDQAQVMAGDHPELPQAFLHKPYMLTELRNALTAALLSPLPSSGNA